MIGDLYIIKNDINNKVYIGKTYVGYVNRWNRHVRDAYRIDKYINTKFYNAIRKYGIEHFKIELIDQFEEGILEQKEIEYIVDYDSYHNGYNSTLGGDGIKNVYVDSDLVLEMFNKGISMHKISLECGYTVRQISKIVRDNNIEVVQQTSNKVEQYTLDEKLLRTFESKADAWR